MEYDDPVAPKLLFACDRVQLLDLVRKYKPDYLETNNSLEGGETKNALDALTAQVSAIAEGAAADRVALSAGQNNLLFRIG